MIDDVTVVIPVEKDSEWNRERATWLPDGTRFVIAEHDPGEWASAMNEGVQAAETPLVILSGGDAWHQRKVPDHGDCVEFLSDLCWDCDVTYGHVVHWNDNQPQYAFEGEMFCPHRLRLENYLPSIACVRKEKFLEVGGIQTGLWDLWLRMLDAGAKFKYVPEAVSARDQILEDASPAPSPPVSEATFYFQATPGTAYWRCLVPSRHLPGHAVFNLPRRTPNGRRFDLPQQMGTAVFQFAGDMAHHTLTRYMQRQGIRVLIEVDDNYVQWSPKMMRKAGWTERIVGNGYSVECHRATVRLADGVICTTEHLAKQYRPLNENVFVCGNQIDPADWPDPVKPEDGKFRIGWFASGSHQEDAKLIYRALDWASSQPDVEIVMIGTGVTRGKPWFKFPFKHYPWSSDFGVYRKFLTEFDVGLAPVVGTPWALCRSDLKALEYGMAQALPVVSDVPPYDTVDVDKAKTPRDFLRIIQHLVRNRDETRQRAKEWREYVLAKRTIQHNIGDWRKAIHGTN